MTTASIDIDAPHLDAVYLGGTWVKPLAGATVDVVMPSTGRIVATAADPGKIGRASCRERVSTIV